MIIHELAQPFFNALTMTEDFLWEFLGAPIILLLGFYFSFKSRFIQLRRFPAVIKTFYSYLSRQEDDKKGGVHPIKIFFACVGGCIGIGNIVGICIAVQIGGPGALFWVWVTALGGVMLKYAEVYLGIRFRVPHGSGYRGGPMYYLKQAFSRPFIPALSALLLCVYGVEVYQFRVVTESMVHNFGWDPIGVAVVLLALVLLACSGGVDRVGSISTLLIPLFVVLYLIMGLRIIFDHASELPHLLAEVVISAFTGDAAMGGFIGSTLYAAVSQGVRRGAYSGDVGVGYASVIYSETSSSEPEKQASLVIFDMFLDTFIVCTLTILIILATGLWQSTLPATLLIQTALANYFPYVEFFVPLFLFLLGYSTINAYFVVGLNSAEYLSPRYGKVCFYLYAICAFLFFSFAETRHALALMAVSGGLLLVINGIGIFILRDKVSYKF